MKKTISIIMAVLMLFSTNFGAVNAFAVQQCLHNDVYYESNYDGTHTMYCYDCEVELKQNCNYKFVNLDSEEHERYCTKCYDSDYFSHTFKQTGITKATTSNNGSISYKCAKCSRTKKKTISRPKAMLLSKSTFSYDGKIKKPTVKVKDANGKIIPSSNYTVTYAKGRKNVGKYKVTVNFKGDKYKGSLSKTFKINPRKTSITSLSASKNTIKVKWSKRSTQNSGYQIRYSKKSSMSNAKKITISSTSTTSKTVKSLSYKTKYYFQVRTYKNVNGKKYYSKWSDKKSKTTPAKKTSSSSSSSSSSSNPVGGYVYITETGSCYHSRACGRGTYYKVTLSEAKSYGLRPCKKCF